MERPRRRVAGGAILPWGTGSNVPAATSGEAVPYNRTATASGHGKRGRVHPPRDSYGPRAGAPLAKVKQIWVRRDALPEVGRPQNPRILIVRLSAVGDTALTLPLLFALRERLPRAFLGWVVGEGLTELDRVHVWRQKERNAAGLFRLAGRVKREGYDLSIDPQGLSISALLPFLARILTRLGFARGPLESRELAPLLTNRTKWVPRAVTHIAFRTLHLGAPSGSIPPFGRGRDSPRTRKPAW